MADENWYRNEVWNDEIQKRFTDKLNKARSQKTQYLKIQAFYLLDKYPNIALKLIQHSREIKIDEFWEQEFCLYESKAYYALKENSLAIKKAFESIEWRRKKTGTITENIYWLSELVLRLEEKSEYQKCLKIMKEMHEETPFPIIEYKYHGYMALLLNELGNVNDSISEALIAIDWANRDKNMLNNVRKLKYGLLKSKTEWPYTKLKEISKMKFA
ncbi:hypothetical protein [Treponema pedis]|nr:hypothetical protein [Treponema pedis]